MREPDAAAAAAGSTCTPVSRGPCDRLSAAPVTTTTTSAASTIANAREEAAACAARGRANAGSRRPEPTQYSYGSPGSGIGVTVAGSITSVPSAAVRTVPSSSTQSPTS